MYMTDGSRCKYSCEVDWSIGISDVEYQDMTCNPIAGDQIYKDDTSYPYPPCDPSLASVQPLFHVSVFGSIYNKSSSKKSLTSVSVGLGILWMGLVD